MEPAEATKATHNETQGVDGQKTDSDASARIRDLEAQVKEKEAKYLYLYADFENYKKRSVKERADLLKYGWESAARDLLEVIDNLERALEHMPVTTDKVLVAGLHMVINQFKATLNKQGIQTIDVREKSFDPNLHEAVSQEDSDHPAGTVIREHLAGYTLHGRLLRPSRVTVSGGKKA